jgi:hypothetical protein
MIARPDKRNSMTNFTHDLALSAVPYDTLLVAELSQRLTPRLPTLPFWAGNAPHESMEATTGLLGDSSRLALVLHQRLWGRDGMTNLDEAVLRDRLIRHPASVIVVTLDDETIPEWLSSAPRCHLADVGLDGVTDFALDAIVAAGGSTRNIPAAAADAEAEPPKRWLEGPAPFLAQPRAHSALRRELDALATELKPLLRLEEAFGTDRTIEIHSLPNRLIARIDDVGISFSWVPGRLGTVADGRLLVIQWKDVAAQSRGISALKSATPGRERMYHAEASSPSDWCWRDGEANGRAASTANLVAEWVAGASIASAASAAATAALHQADSAAQQPALA